jgi:hypothetical protein
VTAENGHKQIIKKEKEKIWYKNMQVANNANICGKYMCGK